MFTEELFMNGNKITVLRDPTSDEDAATKRYVDTVDSKLSTLKAEHDVFSGTLSTLKSRYELRINDHNTVDGKLYTLKAEYDVHVCSFTNLRKNFRKVDKIAEGFFGKTLIIPGTKFVNSKTSIDAIKKTRGDIISDNLDINNKIEFLETHQSKILHKRINNVVYTISSESTTFSEQNNSIKHTAEVTDVYRLSVFSAAKFEIFTTYPWHHSTDRF